MRHPGAAGRRPVAAGALGRGLLVGAFVWVLLWLLTGIARADSHSGCCGGGDHGTAGGGAAVAATAAVAASSRQKDREKSCQELLARKERTAERARRADEDTRAAMSLLAKIRADINRAEADHQALMGELAGAAAYFAGATAAAGALASLFVRTICQRVAQMYSGMAAEVGQVPATLSRLRFESNIAGLGRRLPYKPPFHQDSMTMLIQDIHLSRFRQKLILENADAAISWAAAADTAGGVVGTATGAGIGGLIASEAPGLLDPLKNGLIIEHANALKGHRDMEARVEELLRERKAEQERAREEASDAANRYESECGGGG
ncbi:MAG: hypothetical protein HY658_08195 [Actinobacteria bacterium]|nr:hypothetical protein [Actinomycetota bacterium]